MYEKSYLVYLKNIHVLQFCIIFSKKYENASCVCHQKIILWKRHWPKLLRAAYYQFGCREPIKIGARVDRRVKPFFPAAGAANMFIFHTLILIFSAQDKPAPRK